MVGFILGYLVGAAVVCVVVILCGCSKEVHDDSEW